MDFFNTIVAMYEP